MLAEVRRLERTLPAGVDVDDVRDQVPAGRRRRLAGVAGTPDDARWEPAVVPPGRLMDPARRD